MSETMQHHTEQGGGYRQKTWSGTSDDAPRRGRSGKRWHTFSVVARGAAAGVAALGAGGQGAPKSIKNGLWAQKLLAAPLFALGAKFPRDATAGIVFR